MAEPYVGEIRMFGGTYAPDGWLPCDGRQISIANYEALFALIGTTYGGDGMNTFAVPDLRGRVPMHSSTTHPIGQMAGVESVTLNSAQLAAHSHAPQVGAGNGSSSAPAGHFWAGNSDFKSYTAQPAPAEQFASAAIGAAGGSQAHDNMMPYLTMSFIIATQGVYPPFDN